VGTEADQPNTKRTPPDWERIEADYRAGVLSVREIAEGHGISHTAIQKRAKAKGWSRDLKDRVMAAAKAKVANALPGVAESVAGRVAAATEDAIVEAASSVVASILITQREDIARYRRLGMRMLGELEEQLEKFPELEQIGELLRKEDENGVDRLNDAYQKVLSLPNRSKTLKDLGDVLKVLIALEREAYGVKSVETEEREKADPFAGKSDNEIARRLAFALHKGLTAGKGGQ